MASDKPIVHLSLSALEAEVSKPEPFVLALSGGKRITFPDLFDMPADEATEFFEDLERTKQTDFSFLEKWLPKKDFEAYKAEKISLRVHAALIQRVLDYYEQTVGKPGEGRASAS
ncbi:MULTISPECIES: hypothetical protein [Arthrobacter]|uniref:Uncharacterized protein n=1 Tax=Arthrobacter terricola TaxID=2547396 RepID=A0A4R5KD19_9MICC|nr:MULTISPECIES: hypothetical protein [Arthrobacter]MBT8162793.1 hypothetical protein [Arthrobacter sp. GN70]TDF92047.1 hypothetical protein E1809_18885 [Arthrobacter terricola]